MCIRIDTDQGHLLRWSRLVNAWVVDETWDRESKFPASIAPIMLIHESRREIVSAQWGVSPSWPKNSQPRSDRLVNARSETLLQKPTWKTSIRQRRCIVPASAFYEQEAGRWAMFRARDGILPMAGLYEPPNKLNELPTFAVITCPPNEQIAPYQDRMPVVLANEDIEYWLDPDADVIELHSLFRPCPVEWTTYEDAGSNERSKKTNAINTPSLFDE